MTVIAWIVVGMLGGFIGSMVVNRRGPGTLVDLFLGIFGAVLAGWAFESFGRSVVTGINPDSILASAAGAIVVLVVYHLLRGSPARA
jgi:uncharacterized membrane protein YeaQ/YmgE (transglycosylase-associated protein family)